MDRLIRDEWKFSTPLARFLTDFRLLLNFLTFDDQVKLGSRCANAMQTELRFLCLQVYSIKIQLSDD